MKTTFKQGLCRQQGLSMIGLLIGLLISMLGILASLTLYKNLLHVATESKIDTLYDGQLASALSIMQVELQSAGYGIDDADGDDVVRRFTAASGSDHAKLELLWRYHDGTNFVCRGLLEHTKTITDSEGDNREVRELTLRKVDSGCDDTTALTSMTWSDDSLLARWPMITTLQTYLSGNNTIFSFTITSASCSPFGLTTGEQHLQVTVISPSSTTLNRADSSAENHFQYCLPNTYPTT